MTGENPGENSVIATVPSFESRTVLVLFFLADLNKNKKLTLNFLFHLLLLTAEREVRPR